jgi:hypothetical protein
MSIRIGNYTFDGPFLSIDSIEDRAGVYAVLCKKDDKYTVVDVGESAEVKTRLANHDRKDCWEENCTGTLYYAVYYTPNLQQSERKEIEKEIRDQYNPPCGEI